MYQNVDIYPIFQGEQLRKTITTVIYIYDCAFFSQIAFFMFGAIAILISMLESCLIQSCLPQFRGTYDDRQDALLAVDWDAQEEQIDR